MGFGHNVIESRELSNGREGLGVRSTLSNSVPA